MLLPARLRLTTLGDVLGAVYREAATGVVELTEVEGTGAGRVHRISVQGGLVVDVETQLPTTRIGKVLLRAGLVGPDAVARLEARLALFPDRRAGELLVADGRATSRDVAYALRVQRKERLERLFLLSDARVAFRVPRGAGSASSPLGSEEVLYGRSRFRDRNGGEGAGGANGGRRRDPVRCRALATLGLPEAADAASVQRAFRKLAGSLHPDRFPTANAAERADIMKRFSEITAAYHALVA